MVLEVDPGRLKAPDTIDARSCEVRFESHEITLREILEIEVLRQEGQAHGKLV